LISSETALLEVIALAAAGELSLTEISSAIRRGPSAAQRGLQILVEDGLASRQASSVRPAYQLSGGPRTASVVELAQAEIGPELCLAIAARACRAIEFLAQGPDRIVVVFKAGSSADEQARAAEFIERTAGRLGRRVQFHDHDDLRRVLLNDPGLRARVARMAVLKGFLDRSFPDRSRHAQQPGKALGKTHPDLPRPSKRASMRLRREHRLTSIKVFGSAVRSDFRPDSDVDVLVSFEPGVRATVRSLARLESDLERIFQRDVEVVRADQLRPEVKRKVEEEAVPLP